MYVDVTENVVTTTGSSTSEQVAPWQTTRMTCIALPDQLVFVDCGVIPQIASRFRSDMEERFGRNTSHLLLTHTHWDHIFAMEAFEDVTVITSKVGIQYLQRNLQGMLSREKRVQIAKTRFADRKEIAECYKNANLFLPHIGVKEKLAIGPEEREIIFRVIGGHSKDSASIYLPAEKVLCTGDNLLTCYAQLPGNPTETFEIFDYWETLDIDNVVPGHGDVVGKKFIAKVRTFFEELIAALENLKSQELSEKEVVNHPNLPSYFGEELPSWIEGGKYHTQWLELNIKSWYRCI